MQAMAYKRRDLTADEKRILGENLKVARETRANIKLGKDAAERIGVSPTQISLWEQGHTGMELPRLLDVAAAYGVPIDDLVVGLNQAYDKVIRQRLPLNVRRLLQARIDAVMLSDVEMAEHAAVADQRRPIPESTAARRPSSKGKHGEMRQGSSAHARLRPPK
jgi:transcriptional regulator with XRE-family HTH domain